MPQPSSPPPFLPPLLPLKGKKKAPTTLKPTPAVKFPSRTNAPTAKKGITMRERRLIIKRNSSPLTPTAMGLRDAINRAISSTHVQTVSLTGGNITITTMESIKATLLNSKASAFLHLIPGATTIYLDTLTIQPLVHSLPTCHSLAMIATELTTFNLHLALTQQTRWLAFNESRTGKSASSIIITITSPKAPLFVNKRLSAFSTIFRTERWLRFNAFTQCSNCHHFGHHSNKCVGPLCAAVAPSYTQLGSTPAPHLPADFEPPPVTTSLRGVSTAMAPTNPNLLPAPLALSTTIHLMRRN
ncbi:hypothetical protein L873DRAFT_1843143 [Choiromyces venosus 120613-1]|uniref:CCHC-type domain-containing protein n=1 Tax=Choiromyces venosus 120613-1 TaxID=1336337 RepID=A0A3N4JPH6_9PEZI|nr:hypothetical protein L873DRAFT_1843143 [Choiromyces venosus 120613-1]